jgi:hypothetical protein
MMLRKAAAAMWDWAWGSAAVGTTPAVDAFLAGRSVRECAYRHTTGDNWPERVRSVEADLREHIQAQEDTIADLERALAAALGDG